MFMRVSMKMLKEKSAVIVKRHGIVITHNHFVLWLMTFSLYCDDDVLHKVYPAEINTSDVFLLVLRFMLN